jgi:hypothetical protein
MKGLRWLGLGMALGASFTTACSDEPDSANPARGGQAGSGMAGSGAVAGNGGMPGGSAGAGDAGTSAAGTASGSSGAPGSGGSAGESACSPGTPSLLFVVDSSGSMDLEAEGTSNSRWEILHDLLANAIFPGLPDATRVGLFTFPNRRSEADPCFESLVSVPIAPLGVAQRDDLDSALAVVTPEGGTPTHDAYLFALATLDASTDNGPKAIVLITDGLPNYSKGCMGSDPLMPVDPQPLLEEISGAHARGIRTFVIGWLGTESEDRRWLSNAAVRGGTAEPGCVDPMFCHNDASVDLGIDARLFSVMQRVFCDF